MNQYKISRHFIQEGKRKIVLFNYISWPERSVPETPTNFLTFIYNIRHIESLRPNTGPMVCHCSGGTGRTGTFIGLWNSLDRLTSKSDLDLLCLVGQMRQQRRKIVFNSVRVRPVVLILGGDGRYIIQVSMFETFQHSRCRDRQNNSTIRLMRLINF